MPLFLLRSCKSSPPLAGVGRDALAATAEGGGLTTARGATPVPVSACSSSCLWSEARRFMMRETGERGGAHSSAAAEAAREPETGLRAGEPATRLCAGEPGGSTGEEASPLALAPPPPLSASSFLACAESCVTPFARLMNLSMRCVEGVFCSAAAAPGLACSCLYRPARLAFHSLDSLLESKLSIIPRGLESLQLERVLLLGDAEVSTADCASGPGVWPGCRRRPRP